METGEVRAVECEYTENTGCDSLPSRKIVTVVTVY